tara:strand:- start:89 stop:385 length:297 start_codon:yes stop_codon:yes gene_type:complete
MSIYYNLNGSTAQTTELIAPDLEHSFDTLNISNTHDTNEATVSLFISDPVQLKNYHYFKNVKIPSGTSISIENNFNYKYTFGLYLTTGGSDTLDVIIS